VLLAGVDVVDGETAAAAAAEDDDDDDQEDVHARSGNWCGCTCVGGNPNIFEHYLAHSELPSLILRQKHALEGGN
jgi:hypothetical protein